MIQIIVTGKVNSVVPALDHDGKESGFEVELHEKVWDGKQEVVRIWTIRLDKYQGDKLKKAMFQIKFFGFVCDAFRMEWEWQGEKKGMVIWYAARGNKFFTL